MTSQPFQTFSSLLGLFAAFSLYPNVLQKAQYELDAVVGPHRLPNFSDYESLPYVNAVIAETLRWHNVAPTGAPHLTTADEVLRGYFIPAGSLVIPNIWYAAIHFLKSPS